MSTSWRGQTILITGAAGGVGQACAQLMAAEGAHLALVDRDEAGLARLAGVLGNQATAACWALDVTDAAAVTALIANIEAQLGPCLLYTSPSPRDRTRYRMQSSA